MKKKKKRVSVTDGMDKTGWIRDNWHPQIERGYWMPYDDFYRFPLIPPDPYTPENADTGEWFIAEQQRLNLITLIRHEAVLEAKAAFHKAYRAEKKKKSSHF